MVFRLKDLNGHVYLVSSNCFLDRDINAIIIRAAAATQSQLNHFLQQLKMQNQIRQRFVSFVRAPDGKKEISFFTRPQKQNFLSFQIASF